MWISSPTFGAKSLPMGYDTNQDPGIGHCLECGDIIEYGHGRPDRKFCSASCKIRWHYKRKARSWQAYQHKVLKALEDNHSILERLHRIGVYSIDRMSLGQLGFDFNYVTSYHKIGQRSVYSVYDITYEATPSRILHISSRWCEQEEETGEGAVSGKKPKRPSSAASAGP